MVELVFGKVETADQGTHAPAFRLQRDHRTLGLGRLNNHPSAKRLSLAGAAAQQADDRPALDALARARLVGQRRLRAAQPIAADLHIVARAQGCQHPAGPDFGDDGSTQFVVVRVIGQGLRDGGVLLAGIAGQPDHLLRPAVGLAPLQVEQAATQRFVRGGLLGRDQTGGDGQTARVGLLAKLGEDDLARHLGRKLGMQLSVLRRAELQLLGLGGAGLGGADHADVQHPVDHQDLALLGAAEVGHRVGVGRVLGQTCQHRRFGQAEVFQRLAEIDAGRRLEAISALAEVHVVHVDLQNLPLAQRGFDLEGQQDFDEFARVVLLFGQVEVARHLLGEGGRALASPVRQVGQRGAQHGAVGDRAVLEKIGVLDRQQRVLHRPGNFVERQKTPPLRPELTDLNAVGGDNAQRLLGLVVRQVGDVGQGRVDQRDSQAQQGDANCQHAGRDGQ